MTNRIRVKMGSIEIEYEGSEEFLKNELLKFISSISDIQRESGLIAEGEKTDMLTEKEGEKITPPSLLKLTTQTIASKLHTKTGPDLVMAACAHLAFSKGKQSFTRQEILDDMKSDSSHFKKSYSNNLSSYLESLIKGGKLNGVAKDTYALNDSAAEDLRKRIAT